MNYSASLPKISFESSIGSFTIPSFYSFYEYEPSSLNLTETYVDNRTTLTELSQKIYKDDNSIWLFLIANQTTDPFSLLAQNPTNETEKTVNNITLGLYQNVSTENYLNPIGSILVPPAVTGGSAWQYSSVGNFDLDGPFALIDSTDYYTAKMTIKEQLGPDIPFITKDVNIEDYVIAIQNTSAGFTTDDQEYTTKAKKPYSEDVTEIIIAKSKTIDPGTSNYPPQSAFGPPVIPSYGNDGATSEVTNYEVLIAQDKNIKVIVPTSVSSIFNNLKKMSYT